MSNIIKASFGAMKRVRTRPVWRIDHGMILQFAGLDLPQAYEVHFSNSRTVAAKIVIGDENGVVIPSEYFKDADQIFAWLYLHTGEDDGWTAYEVEIPLQLRPDTTPEQPTPEEQSAIEQAITALNRAVEITGEDVIAANAAKDAAADSAAEALGSADSAQGSARSAASDADRAETAKGLAENAAQTAEAAKAAAVAAKEGAEAAVAGFDADVEQARGEITQLVSEAGEAAEAAGDSAAAAGQAASVATQKASEASAAALAAAQSETTAETKAGEASDSASAAASSAALAAQKATDAGGSATAAQAAQTAAEAAQTAAETAQTAAETAAQSVSDAAAQIQKNTDDILSIYPTDTASGSIASFADGADDVPVRSLVVSIAPVQSGTGDPSPENVRPISGWDAVNISVANENIIAEYSEHPLAVSGDEYIYYYTAGTSVLFRCKEGVSYYLHRGEGATRNVWAFYREKPIPGRAGVGSVSEAHAASSAGPVVAPLTGWCVIFVRQSEFNEDIAKGAQVSLSPLTDVSLPYTTGVTVDLGQTVYGGTLDVASGTVKARPYYASYAGETLVGPWVSSMDVYAPGATPTTGAQVVDMGGAETTVQLTPQEVKTLLGLNNIWADAGDVDVTYRADVQLYIQRLTQPAEDDRTANANIPANTYFMIGNTLYFSTAAIAAGETIAPGTNCTETNLAAALNALNA